MLIKQVDNFTPPNKPLVVKRIIVSDPVVYWRVFILNISL